MTARRLARLTSDSRRSFLRARHLEAADLRRLAARTGRRQPRVAVIDVAVVDAHAVRIRVGRAGNRHDFEDLARLGIDLLYGVIAGDEHPERTVVPVEPVRAIAG